MEDKEENCNMPLKNNSIMSLMSVRSAAHGDIAGDASHPRLRGKVDFYPYKGGTVMIAELWGLPYDPAPCAANIFAMHIHSVGDCSGDMPFSAAGAHYDEGNCPHPAHSGDLPPLFGNRGYGWQAFYTERFTPKDIIGKAVIIHVQRDDFTTQPAGDAGGRIGCGVIRPGR